MYQALYRTWRPQVFEDVVGQTPITSTLRHEVSTGHLAHAYLFTGSRGTGKTTCSKILAKVANCLHPVDGDPCGVCENCVAISEGAMTDILEIDAASNNSVEDIRALREEAIFAPAMGKYRVYIIDEAHMLSKSAFNALLKIMEEPPQWVLFILATTEVHKIPATILSRCQRFDFRRVSAEDIGHHLLKIAKEESIELEPDAALLIGQIADGGMRDAISLLDQCAALGEKVNLVRVRQVAGLVDTSKVSQIVDAIIHRDTGVLLATIGEMHGLSVDFKQLSENLLENFRNLMVIKAVKQPRKLVHATDEEMDRLIVQAGQMEMPQILYAMDRLQELYQRIGSDRSAIALFEMTVLKISTPEYSDEKAALSARIGRLESGKECSSKGGADPSEVKAAEMAKIPDEPMIQPGANGAHEISTSTEEDSSSFIPDLPAPVSILSSMETPADIVEIEGELEEWQAIVARIKKKNPPLHATLEGSKAFLKGDILLIDAENPVFFDLMRASDMTKESLRAAISEVTGKVYRLGPLKKGTTVKEKPKGMVALREAAKKTGVEVTEK